MLDAVLFALGVAAGYALTWREVARLRADSATHASRAAQLTTLLMAREAPQEFAAYLDPTPPPPPLVPETAIWDESGLWYIDPED